MLHYATGDNNSNLIGLLLEKGADIDAKNNNGATPLHLAIFNNQLSIVKKLIEKGADIGTENNDGNTPLHFAASYGNLHSVEKLVEKEADINAKNKGGITPLDIARSRKHSNIMKYFEKKLNKEREPIQRKRRHYHGHLSRKSLAMDSSNQLEVAISRAARTSSSVGDPFTWVKDSVGRLFSFSAALPKKSESSTVQSSPIAKPRKVYLNTEKRNQ